MIHLMIAFGLIWTTQTIEVDGHELVQHVAHPDAARMAVVEEISWEGPTFWAWEAADCGMIFGLGEEPTKEAAQVASLVAVAKHQARQPHLACGKGGSR